MERSRGVPDQEMFLSQPAPTGEDGGDSPTVEPLRIFKPQSPANAGGSAAQRYPTPPSAFKQSFPLPPGASSSAAPLPFPDDEEVHKPTPPAPYGSSYSLATSPRLDTASGEKKPGLAERRGAAPKPIHSPTSPDGDQGLFARPLQASSRPGSNPSYPEYQKKTYYPPPGASNHSASTSNTFLHAPEASDSQGGGVNRFASTASVSTTRASRGSPPPPETPIVEPGQAPGAGAGGIEARYAASGISGTATLNSLQAHQVQSAAASQRLAQYNNQPPVQRPWRSCSNMLTCSPSPFCCGVAC